MREEMTGRREREMGARADDSRRRCHLLWSRRRTTAGTVTACDSSCLTCCLELPPLPPCSDDACMGQFEWPGSVPAGGAWQGTMQIRKIGWLGMEADATHT